MKRFDGPEIAPSDRDALMLGACFPTAKFLRHTLRMHGIIRAAAGMFPRQPGAGAHMYANGLTFAIGVVILGLALVLLWMLGV